MAGSYEHIKDGWSLIENMGDAYEAVEELMWLVQRGIGDNRACELLDKEFYPQKRGEQTKSQDLLWVEGLMEK